MRSLWIVEDCLVVLDSLSAWPRRLIMSLLLLSPRQVLLEEERGRGAAQLGTGSPSSGSDLRRDSASSSEMVAAGGDFFTLEE